MAYLSKAKQLEEARNVKEALEPIEANLQQDIRSVAVENQVSVCESSEAEVKRLSDLAAKAKKNERAAYRKLRDLIKRVRSGVKSHYGDDSIEFAAVGGTPLSARKKPNRKKKTDKNGENK